MDSVSFDLGRVVGLRCGRAVSCVFLLLESCLEDDVASRVFDQRLRELEGDPFSVDGWLCWAGYNLGT